jgi:hypothetical protein
MKNPQDMKVTLWFCAMLLRPRLSGYNLLPRIGSGSYFSEYEDLVRGSKLSVVKFLKRSRFTYIKAEWEQIKNKNKKNCSLKSGSKSVLMAMVQPFCTMQAFTLKFSIFVKRKLIPYRIHSANFTL